jgi:hypothetical protein
VTGAFARRDERTSAKHTLSSLYTLYWIASIHEFSLIQLDLRTVTSAQESIN